MKLPTDKWCVDTFIERPQGEVSAYVETQGPAHRITFVTGWWVDLPISASIKGLTVGGSVMCSVDLALPQDQKIRYTYIWVDNLSKPHIARGDFTPSHDECELLGWLVGGGNLNSSQSQKQSLRFAHSDPWALKRVERLVNICFGKTVKCTMYPKAVGFDLVMTSGINNPLRHFLRRMGLHHGVPVGAAMLGQQQMLCFLRGLWAADGWVSLRKGGNQVIMGLSWSDNLYRNSFLWSVHQKIGMYASLYERKSKKGLVTGRLLFDGWSNYDVFRRTIRNLAHRILGPPPVFKPRSLPLPVLSYFNHRTYNLSIKKITRLGNRRYYESLGNAL